MNFLDPNVDLMCSGSNAVDEANASTRRRCAYLRANNSSKLRNPFLPKQKAILSFDQTYFWP